MWWRIFLKSISRVTCIYITIAYSWYSSGFCFRAVLPHPQEREIVTDEPAARLNYTKQVGKHYIKGCFIFQYESTVYEI